MKWFVLALFVLVSCGQTDEVANETPDEVIDETPDEVVDETNYVDLFNAKIGELVNYRLDMIHETASADATQMMHAVYSYFDERNASVVYETTVEEMTTTMQMYFVEEDGVLTHYSEIPMFGYMKTTEDVDLETLQLGKSFLIEDPDGYDYEGKATFEGEELYAIVPNFSDAMKSSLGLTTIEGLTLTYYVLEDGTPRYIDYLYEANGMMTSMLFKFYDVGLVDEIVVPDEVKEGAVSYD